MKSEYTFTGRSGETHKLVKTQLDGVYQVLTDYSIGTTGHTTEIMSLDFSGGPTLYIGDIIEFGVMIESIKHYNELGIYVTLKEIKLCI